MHFTKGGKALKYLGVGGILLIYCARDSVSLLRVAINARILRDVVIADTPRWDRPPPSYHRLVIPHLSRIMILEFHHLSWKELKET